ncbi:ornithine cyclodeaminase family protein [Haloplanus halophilus]|uniref:ornithine cyclodeaminase family protein n=1 Tax=Haloplanus halophilus TaxID=2949993 RepID=UPI00203A97BB|nr:ornithine cyclodeaminase family protein [Haloplanus sp. GDY1]
METFVLDDSEVAEHAHTPALVSAVEDAFAAYATGAVEMPAKSYVEPDAYGGDFRSMPAYVDADGWDAAGVKWVSVYPDNPEAHGLPTVLGLVIYSDPATGFPLAVMDGTELTMRRTGAAAAVATDHLAVDDATSMGIVGAGVQSYAQLEAVSTVRPIGEVVVSDPDDERVDRFVEAFEDEFTVRSGDVGAAAACDVLSTVTPVEDPIVTAADLGERTHVNAVGADAPGKRELADGVVEAAKLVIDDHEQCTHSGEINVPWTEGTLDAADVHGELGEIVTGRLDGRVSADGVTVFDSTGLAIQDVAAARIVYEAARDDGADAYDFLS